MSRVRGGERMSDQERAALADEFERVRAHGLNIAGGCQTFAVLPTGGER